MIIIKSEREINLMRQAGEVVAAVFEAMESYIKPGISTLDVSNEAERIIRSHGAVPTFLNYNGFKGAVCTSVNDVVVHGIPSKKEILNEGDIISVDVGATLNGYIADACRTFPVGKISMQAQDLIDTTRLSFFEGVKLIKPGVKLGDVQAKIQSINEDKGYSIVKEFTGHGVGTILHEDPMIPNYGKQGTGITLKKGMTLAIEPMVCAGRCEVNIQSDGRTTKTADGKYAAHYENTFAITEQGIDILTLTKEEKKLGF